MLYLIKSPKWTRHYKKDTYWGTNQCGYVTLIANAGFYSEEEVLQITKHSSNDGAMPIEVTKEILDKAYRQLRKSRKEIFNDKEREEERYNRIVKDLQIRDKNIDVYFALLEDISTKLN